MLTQVSKMDFLRIHQDLIIDSYYCKTCAKKVLAVLHLNANSRLAEFITITVVQNKQLMFMKQTVNIDQNGIYPDRRNGVEITRF